MVQSVRRIKRYVIWIKTGVKPDRFLSIIMCGENFFYRRTEHCWKGGIIGGYATTTIARSAASSLALKSTLCTSIKCWDGSSSVADNCEINLDWLTLECITIFRNFGKGRAMAQAVSRRPVTAEARVRSRGQSMWDLWWTKWHWDSFFPEYFGFSLSISFQWCSIKLEKQKKLIIFITGLHNKSQGCGASVASAAGPFTTKKNFGNDSPNYTASYTRRLESWSFV
jgi:hypothetical protein